MSELKVDTITASDGTSPVTLTKQSAAKAFCNFDGTGTAAFQQSLNMSSITDNGTGDFTVIFTNSFGAATFGFVGGAMPSGASRGHAFPNTLATNSLRSQYQSTDSSGNLSSNDPDDATQICFGDLA